MYPMNIMDLICACWSQRAKERPTTSQIVSIATAPEFTHLIDIVSVECASVLSADVVELLDYSGNEMHVKWVCKCDFPYGLVARILGFHPRGPGSIPGMGTFFPL